MVTFIHIDDRKLAHYTMELVSVSMSGRVTVIDLMVLSFIVTKQDTCLLLNIKVVFMKQDSPTLMHNVQCSRIIFIFE